MNTVITIPAFGDNYIYLCKYDENNAFVIDPCDNAMVQKVLDENNLNLTTIFITHHHWDHTAGIKELKEGTDCKVIGSDKRIPDINEVVSDSQIIEFGNTKIQVIATPGHTRTSVCYYLQPTENNANPILWTGDTMFVNGCGRILEGNARTMLDSLLKLASLPDDTLVYCGHDYTMENYEFALSIEPDNETVQRRLQEVRQMVKEGKTTVPSTILQERTTNPFLRSDTAEIKIALSMPNADMVDVFAEMRRRKDFF